MFVTAADNYIFKYSKIGQNEFQFLKLQRAEHLHDGIGVLQGLLC
jgi:hypothetical protein